MNGRFTKILTYVFFACLILLFVLNNAAESQTWVPIVRSIALYLSIACAIIYIAIMVYCIIENKKIDKLIYNDKYDELIAYAKKKANKKALILDNRKAYYNYLLLLSYLAKDEENVVIETFSSLEGHENMFPVVSYWKVCFNFSKGNYESLEEDYTKFKNSKEVARAPYKYGNLLDLLNSFILYSKGNIKEAKEIINKLDTHNISMPCTIRGINLIKDAEVLENIEEQVEENVTE